MTTVYITKKFTSGLLKGLIHIDAVPGFESPEKASAWVSRHRVKPVKGILGTSNYIIVDASFQDYRR